MADARILDWLRGIDAGHRARGRASVPQDPQADRPVLKRKRRRGLPSPSPSARGPQTSARIPAMDTPSPRGKKRRTGADGGSPTPRPPRRLGDLDAASQDSLSAASSSGALSLSTTSSAKRSRASPTKQLGRLEVADFDPVHLRQMDVGDDDMPSALASVIADIGIFADGEGVIDAPLKETILGATESARGLKKIRDKCFVSSDLFSQLAHPELLTLSPPRSPPLAEAVDIFNAAKACRVDRHAETDWNLFVHSRLLALASANPWAEPTSPDTSLSTKFTPCTAARISHAYRPRSGGSKMVDFAMFIEPSPHLDEPARNAIDDLRRTLPGESINHTDYAPLRHRPLTLSVESKTTGHQLSEAEVQLGVWHAAQWRMLEGLVKETPQEGSADETQWPVTVKRQAPGQMPPFLPAIIVQGHDWHFVATTRRGADTILWVKQAFGSTDSVLGVYQVARVLHYLVCYMEATYWPWFRTAILGLPSRFPD